MGKQLRLFAELQTATPIPQPRDQPGRDGWRQASSAERSLYHVLNRFPSCHGKPDYPGKPGCPALRANSLVPRCLGAGGTLTPCRAIAVLSPPRHLPPASGKEERSCLWRQAGTCINWRHDNIGELETPKNYLAQPQDLGGFAGDLGTLQTSTSETIYFQRH